MPVTRRTVGVGSLLLVAALLAGVVVAVAQGLRLPRALVGGGGGEVAHAGLHLRWAIGQPAAGSVANGLILCSGYVCAPGAHANVGGDTTRPSITATHPRDGASGVPLNQPVYIFFSEPMAGASVDTTAGGTLAVTPTWNRDGTRLTLTHSEFAATTSYTATVTGGTDRSANPLLDAPYQFHFTTGTGRAAEADLQVAKHATGSGQPAAGERVTYTLVITNAGPAGPAIATLVDRFSDPTALVALQAPNCTWSPGSPTATCTLVGLAAGQPTRIQIVATTAVSFSGWLTNTATLTPLGSGVDPNPGNDSAQTAVFLNPAVTYPPVSLPIIRH
jgi:uncharacterized repeat protein (TIGR01451 family)